MSKDAKAGGKVTRTRRRTFAGADYIVTLLESKRRGRKGAGLLGFGCRGAGLAIDLLLRAEDAAPVLVIRHGHAALDADMHSLCGRWGIRREEPLEKRHSGSPGYSGEMLSVRNFPRSGYNRPVGGPIARITG